MRLMSFALTTAQIIRREKTVTRRTGWQFLKAGELILAVDKCMGLARGQSPISLAVLAVTSVTREPLSDLTRRAAKLAINEVRREGFPDQTPKMFVSMFTRSMRCTPETIVTRIEFRYVPGRRFDVPGFCSACGCSEYDPCLTEADGPCWWVDSHGRGTLGQTSLCSHCHAAQALGLPRGPGPISREMEALRS